MPKRKHIKKNPVIPKTDANQGNRERIERKNKQRNYIAKKIAEMKAKKMLEQQQKNAISTDGDSSVIDGLNKNNEIS